MSSLYLNQTEPRHRQEGFTLIEVMVALTVFTIGILALGALQISSIRGNHTSSAFSEAATLASDRMEKLIHAPYDHADLSGEHTETQGLYTLSWAVVNDDPATGCKNIHMVIAFQDRNVQRTISLDYIKADR